MKEENNNSCETSAPQHPCVKTQLTPDDVMTHQTHNDENAGVTEEEVIEAVIEINPDINSMDSRG